jgi:CubicO group peptidase (beta-lactamase class C family)
MSKVWWACVASARVDSIFAHIGSDAPGCALGVYRDGKSVITRSYGIASAESGRPITALTTFNLGSAAKPFTAFAVLLLEEQGRLSLDDDVRRYVPELPDYGTPIRIRDLLQHTSGLRDLRDARRSCRKRAGELCSRSSRTCSAAASACGRNRSSYASSSAAIHPRRSRTS